MRYQRTFIISVDPARPADRYRVQPSVRDPLPLRFTRKAKFEWVKRVVDVSGALLLIVLFLPVFAVVPILILFEIGRWPIYTQWRKGRHEVPFKIYKFRTMRPNAHLERSLLYAQNEVDGILFKMKYDPRVTHLGRILRLYSLDELPQLFNVLLGDMSLAGPRPFSVEVFHRQCRDEMLFSRWMFERHQVKPGMTGLWQVKGRNSLPFRRLMKWDIFYARSWRLTLDFYVFLQTIPVVLLKKGVY